ncbi:type II secretion system protein GspJ [Sinimarinibacterium sp. CAU 1509]|uniref:type II secretion system minor pseudopilin GspJ n=1 Tax=Sinimarinibacterium sp. CAU 1509 TaxID=2562283 RepID=UPI0010AC339A|nr:type II secretion system minor pseudopilin GspJ [Sinimarinibacterium sp. CAU 1509]TJY55777.1 type II secretion system protein GspJ [Sinimarinibacterium sp. CAU 1509]
MKAPGRQSGFTLLELIVVLAIFAIFAVMAYGGLDSVLKTRKQVETAQDRIAELQRTYLRLRNDFQQMRPRPIRDGFGDVQPALAAGDGSYVEFTRAGWRNPLNLPRSGLQRVAYRLDEDKLIRSSWRVLDRAQDSQPIDTILLDKVEEVQWRYLDASQVWHSRWPDIDTNSNRGEAAPPIGVEVRIRTKDASEIHFLFALGSQPPGKKTP